MPNGTLHYRFRIRTATDEADLFVATSLADGDNPLIAEAPSGDGSTLDPLTGKVTVGAYTVKVIDAPGVVQVPGGFSGTDGWEYANQAAAEAAGWVFTDTLGDGSITVGAADQVHGGTRSLKMSTTGGGGLSGTGSLTAVKTYDSGDGIVADTLYTVTVYARASARSPFDVHTRLIVNGVEARNTTAGSFNPLTVTVRSSATATLAVTLYRSHAFVTQTRDVWFDDLSIQGLEPGTTTEGRVVTSVLADAEAKQQLLSKRAFVEESTDEGANWTVLDNGGYINSVKLNDALLWEFTVGDSKRVEQSKRVFDRISDPVEHPLFIGTMDRASCLMGGPIVGDWGAIYKDRGRPAFEVLDDFGPGGFNVGWTNDGGSLHSVYGEDGPPMRDHVAAFINDSSREYVDPDVVLDTVGVVSFALAPGLICRIYDYDTSAWVTDATCILRRIFDGDWGLVSTAGHFSIQWPDDATAPSPGDKYRFAVFPRSISDRNPAHWSGHPMDLVANVLDYCGIAYNLASLQAMGESLGLDLKIHLRITTGETAQVFLENTVYGPFGVAARLNDAGEVEFVLSRSPDTVSSGTVTTADVPDPLEGNPWFIEEASAANRVIVETQSFILDIRRPDSATPFDAIRSAKITTELKAEGQDEQEIYGDKEVRFTLPGSIQQASAILTAGTQLAPGTLDRWAKALAQPLFDWQGRGAIRAELDLRRGVTTAKIGDVLTLDLEYFPSGNERGTDPRRAVILRRTVKPDRVSLLLEDRGLAASLECDPAFTLAADATFPKTTVEVTVTNPDDLASPLRVEMAQGASEPSSAGQFVRLFVPNRDANPFDLPAVCAGNTVWVRMRCEENGQVGTWTAWSSIDLADLTAPSALSAVVNNTTISLTWTNGETTYPVEILARLDADTTLHSVAVLPAGSTSYLLLLTEPSTDYVLGVRYIDPKGCTSATTTVSAATDVPLCLDPPINLSAFADGAGTYGVEMTATSIPGAVEVWVATETAVGSGTAGTYALADTVTGLLDPLRTRWTVSSPTPNDGLLRYMKAESTAPGYTSCSFSDPVSVNPWTLVTPVDPTDPGDPTIDPIIPSILLRIPIFRPGVFPYANLGPGSAREVLTTWRGTEAYPTLDNVTAAYLEAQIPHCETPVGTYLACEFEAPDATGTWGPMEDSTEDTAGPIILLDSASLDALDDNTDEDAWNVRGAAITIRDDAAQDVRVRLVIGGGDDTGAVVIANVDLCCLIGPLGDPGDETGDPPTEDPGSCDTPGDLVTTYANQAAAFLAEPED